MKPMEVPEKWTGKYRIRWSPDGEHWVLDPHIYDTFEEAQKECENFNVDMQDISARNIARAGIPIPSKAKVEKEMGY
jgi:hypothetical protein